MATVKFVLRYNTEQQKKKLEKIAKKCGRSANAHILSLIDGAIAWDKQGGLVYEGNPMPSFSVTRPIPEGNDLKSSSSKK